MPETGLTDGSCSMRHMAKKPCDAASGLIRAVLALGKGEAALIYHEGHDWQSATFSGLRHCMALEFCGDAAIQRGRNLAAILPDHEFDITGHIVIDITVSKCRETRREEPPKLLLEVTALTVEDS